MDVADRLDILNVVARYTNVVDAGDVAALAELFAEDGRFVTSRDGQLVSFTGREEFPAFVAGNLAREAEAMSIHFQGPVEFLVLDANRARTCTRALLGWSRKGTAAQFIAGTYHDTFVKREGRWLILEREFRGDESVMAARPAREERPPG